MKKSKGYRRGTRQLLTKAPREKGKPKLSKLLYEYQLGSQVIIKIDSSVQKGMPHKRFHGKIGTILAKRGRGNLVTLTQGDAGIKIIERSGLVELYFGS